MEFHAIKVADNEGQVTKPFNLAVALLSDMPGPMVVAGRRSNGLDLMKTEKQKMLAGTRLLRAKPPPRAV